MEGGKDGKEGVRAQTEHVRFRQTKKWREGEGRWLLGEGEDCDQAGSNVDGWFTSCPYNK